jgi:hypothetical protein
MTKPQKPVTETGLGVVAGVDVDAGDAFGVEHGLIAGVVFYGHEGRESIGPEFGNGVLLEFDGVGKIAVFAHDQQVPTHAMFFEPLQRFTGHTLRACRAQHNAHGWVEQVTHVGDLFNQGVLAAHLKKQMPVASPSADQVLTVLSVSEYAINIEHCTPGGGY